MGRSNNVGKPAIHLGFARNASVLSCDVHSDEAGLLYPHTATAAVIVVVAAAQASLEGTTIAAVDGGRR